MTFATMFLVTFAVALVVAARLDVGAGLFAGALFFAADFAAGFLAAAFFPGGFFAGCFFAVFAAVFFFFFFFFFAGIGRNFTPTWGCGQARRGMAHDPDRCRQAEDRSP